jgi:long-chain acyl-CoA synthetase
MSAKPWLAHYDKGVPETLTFPDITVADFLTNAAKKYPDKPCTIFNGATLSYKEVDQLSDRLAAGLAGLGVKKGDRVGLFIPNTPQFALAYFALQKLGAVVVAINPLYTPREIEHQVNDAGVELMVLMTNNYAKVKELQARTRIRQIVVTNIKEALPPVMKVLFTLLREKKAGFRVTLRDNDVWMQDLIAAHKPGERPQVAVSGDDTALLQYSGGTTGLSKGVIATHRGLVANTVQIDAWNHEGREGKEVVLLAIPMYHAYGMVVGMLYGMWKGASLVMVPDPRNIKDVLKNIQKYKTSIFPGVPAMYNAINNHPEVLAGKYDLGSIRFCISGSAPLLRETKERFEELTGGHLIEGFGLSEAPVATHCNPVTGENKTGSIGMPLPGVDCRIVSLDDGVTVLPQGEIGELVIKGPQVMRGYHNMPSETMNTVREGWLYTGDIAYMDEDGYFFIVDRKKELIKPGGFQVWPREVEEVIQQHPKVKEVGVAGVPDAAAGEAVKAWVVLKDGETATIEEIRAWCKDKLAGYKVPKQIDFLYELPKTTVGKILRRELVRTHNEAAKTK